MKITNTQPGARGVNTTTGTVLIDPKQTLDVEVYAREKSHIEASGWFEVEGEYTPDPGAAAAPAISLNDETESLKARITELEGQVQERDEKIAELTGGSGGQGTYAVLDKGRGWWAITKDGEEVTKSLREDDVKGFDDLSDDDKAAFVDLHKPE